MTTTSRKVDQNALRTNQAFIITLLLIAFIVQIPVLVAFVSAVLILGTAVPSLALFKRIYQHVLVPSGLVAKRVIDDNPEPHRFSQGLGGAVTGLGAIALFAGVESLGWGLAWLVIGLASLNLFLGFCAGCFMYYQLSKRNVPGFSVQPVGQG